jgi:hypothetical protein
MDVIDGFISGLSFLAPFGPSLASPLMRGGQGGS